jgi:mono/diheme cytochrome c family protein
VAHRVLAEDRGIVHVRSAEEGPGDEGYRHHECGRDEHIVCRSSPVAPLWVESHAPSIVAPVRRSLPGLFRPLLLVTMSGLLWVACSSPPEVPLGPDGKPDPVLADGRDLYGEHCKSCHGNDGGGGRGPSLKQISDKYPVIGDQIAVVTDGKGGQMPPFGRELSDGDIMAVVRYTREVLAGERNVSRGMRQLLTRIG